MVAALTLEAIALVKLSAGRFHQVRAMLAHAGLPLVDAPVYGADRDQEPLDPALHRSRSTARLGLIRSRISLTLPWPPSII